MLEAQVHEQLRAFLRHHSNTDWPHHLTMARLSARALRLGRSSLMQVGASALYQGHYRLSYLMSLLLWPEPAVLVVPEVIRQSVLQGDIPRLQEWMPSQKPVLWGDEWPHENFRGLFLTSPAVWLRDRLYNQNRFPTGMPVFIDGADDLEHWIREVLTVTLDAHAWQTLMQAYPQHQALIRDIRVSLTHQVFQHPANPYQCHLVDEPERQVLMALRAILLDGDAAQAGMPPQWQRFWAQMDRPESLRWTRLNRESGQWTLNCAPIDVAPFIAPHWVQQPLVLMGGALDATTDATEFRQRLGLEDMTCLKFNPDRHTEEIQLYLPDRIPLPNTAEFQPVLQEELAYLVVAGTSRGGFMVVLVDDTPLKKSGRVCAGVPIWLTGAGRNHIPARERRAGDGLALLARPANPTASTAAAGHGDPAPPLVRKSPGGGSRSLLQAIAPGLVSPIPAAYRPDGTAASDRSGASQPGHRRHFGQSGQPPQLRSANLAGPRSRPPFSSAATSLAIRASGLFSTATALLERGIIRNERNGDHSPCDRTC